MPPTALPWLRSIKVQTAFVIGLVAIMLSASLASVLAALLGDRIRQDQGQSLHDTAHVIARALESGLEGRRALVATLSDTPTVWAGGPGGPGVREALHALQRQHSHAAWAGVADPSGRIVAATGDLLLGQDVSGREWFRAGLRGEYIGDVHAAVLLADRLPRGPDGAPARFMDFVSPIVREGSVIGVLCLHGHWAWIEGVVRTLVAPLGDASRIEVIVQGADGGVLYRSGGGDTIEPADLQQVGVAAIAGAGGGRRAVEANWGTDRIFLTAAQPVGDIGGGLAPRWTVLVRQSTDEAYAEAGRAAWTVFGFGMAFSMLAAATAWLGAGFLSRPLTRIAHAAQAVERGDPEARIPRERDNHEMETLSLALGRMTERLTQANHELESRVAQRTRELQHANDRLTRVGAEQSAMLDSDLVGIARIQDRTVVWNNRALERMFGVDDGALRGQPSRSLFRDEETWHHIGETGYRALAAGRRFRTQVRLRKHDGDPIWVDVSGSPLPGPPGDSLWMLMDITELKDYQIHVEHIAFHDPLTGLPNRLLLADRLGQALARARRGGSGLALVYMDLDGFKAVNDTDGHDAGDQLLRTVARRLGRCVRSDDTVARLGGDEFVLLLTGPGGRDGLDHVLQRVLTVVAEPVPLPSGGQGRVSASLGVALHPQDGEQPAALLKAADDAMYRAKRAGKNQVRYAQDDGPDAMGSTNPGSFSDFAVLSEDAAK